MVERRFADYLQPSSAPAPGSVDAPTHPVLAWVRADETGHWSMTIERPHTVAKEAVRGLSWDELVRSTGEAGVEKYLVWSPASETYEPRRSLT